MAAKTRFPGAVESTADAVSYTDQKAAYMDYDTTNDFAQFGAKRSGATSAGVKLRTILVGVALTVLTFTAAGAATFVGAVTTQALAATSGTFSSTLASTGDFAVNTNKFTVTASTGAWLAAGDGTQNGALTITKASGAQLDVRYDSSNHYTSTVASNGAVTFDAVGAGAGFTFSDPVSITGTLATTSTINSQTISAAASFTGTVSAVTAFIVGTNPAATGALRVANAAYLVARNQLNNADKRLIGLDASNVVQIDPDATGANFGGALTVAGAMTVTGAITATTGVTASGCHATRTTNLSTSTGTALAVVFDTGNSSEEFDTDSYHSLSTTPSRFIAPKAGKYLLCGLVAFANNATGERLASFGKNGTEDTSTQSKIVATAAGTTRVCATAVMQLAAADYVELFGTQTSGGNLNIVTGTSFSIVFIGA